MPDATGGTRLNLDYLDRYRCRVLRMGGAEAETREDLDFALLSGLGLSLLETIRFLHAQQPSLEEFESWILRVNGGAIPHQRLDRLRRALAGETVGSEESIEGVPGLGPDDLAHWEEHGYVILRDAVTKKQAGAAESAIYEYLEMDPANPETWYKNPQGHSIWVNLLRHPAFWANRRSSRITKAFSQLWGREDLWVTVDQGGLNPPERPGWPFPGPHLHWDTTIAEPHQFGVQGILYLADVAEDQGAFCCIPGFHRKLPGWLRTLPAGVDPRVAVLQHGGVKPIAASAGDLVIWHHHLPHGASANSATRPRVAQYMTMKPTRWEHHATWR